jgi:hypothetical protein
MPPKVSNPVWPIYVHYFLSNYSCNQALGRQNIILSGRGLAFNLICQLVLSRYESHMYCCTDYSSWVEHFHGSQLQPERLYPLGLDVTPRAKYLKAI